MSFNRSLKCILASSAEEMIGRNDLISSSLVLAVISSSLLIRLDMLYLVSRHVSKLYESQTLIHGMLYD